MAIRDDLLTLLRAKVGEGHERDTLAQAEHAYAIQSLHRDLEALYESRVDDSQVLSARQAIEQQAADEEAQFKNLRAVARAQVAAELRGL